MPAEDAALPPHTPLLTTATGAQVLAFEAPAAQALTWWRRLRDAHPTTGYWPVLLDADAPEYFADAYEYESPADAHARLKTLDGATLLADRWAAKLAIYGPELTAEINTDLNQERPWPTAPERRGSEFADSDYSAGPEALPSDAHDANTSTEAIAGSGSDDTVTVALVPAPAGWMVPVVLHYGGWNDYPDPAEHAAILRYWHDRYGADLVSMTGTTTEFAVARPPRTHPDALRLSWEYRAYNDGYFDFYFADNLTDLAASLLEAPVWRCWWD
ncbi:DUF4253 domain-containing protein [Actinoplanes sp. Pm04-4]|uniref:DUF4253 domain-containing protein n=1 Tax=Paractinoplanes pyxinae TaxID=2997416 RepID=A0ABT4AXG1_9ACTN|nr:DUF4253 domain-containing protein [Actinoplanes pyxinae]MCY1138899.1 DUF4253 domain-containing protein [Actinoplanes pyxinae]